MPFKIERKGPGSFKHSAEGSVLSNFLFSSFMSIPPMALAASSCFYFRSNRFAHSVVLGYLSLLMKHSTVSEVISYSPQDFLCHSQWNASQWSEWFPISPTLLNTPYDAVLIYTLSIKSPHPLFILPYNPLLLWCLQVTPQSFPSITTYSFPIPFIVLAKKHSNKPFYLKTFSPRPYFLNPLAPPPPIDFNSLYNSTQMSNSPTVNIRPRNRSLNMTGAFDFFEVVGLLPLKVFLLMTSHIIPVFAAQK